MESHLRRTCLQRVSDFVLQSAYFSTRLKYIFVPRFQRFSKSPTVLHSLLRKKDVEVRQKRRYPLWQYGVASNVGLKVD
jgi:hypothetical protein